MGSRCRVLRQVLCSQIRQKCTAGTKSMWENSVIEVGTKGIDSLSSTHSPKTACYIILRMGRRLCCRSMTNQNKKKTWVSIRWQREMRLSKRLIIFNSTCMSQFMFDKTEPAQVCNFFFKIINATKNVMLRAGVFLHSSHAGRGWRKRDVVFYSPWN